MGKTKKKEQKDKTKHLKNSNIQYQINNKKSIEIYNLALSPFLPTVHVIKPFGSEDG